MIKTKLTIPPEVEDFLDGISDPDIEDILLDAAEGFCGPGGVLEKHYQEGQKNWGESDEDYQDRKLREYGASEKFEKTGDAKAALTGPSPYRMIKASRPGGVHQVEVALVRIEGGRNIYSIAQAGGKNNAGPPMRITQVLPGDEKIIMPHVEASIEQYFVRKGYIG